MREVPIYFGNRACLWHTRLLEHWEEVNCNVGARLRAKESRIQVGTISTEINCFVPPQEQRVLRFCDGNSTQQWWRYAVQFPLNTFGQEESVKFVTDLTLRCCSAPLGHPSTGTPAHTVSRIEFHPQWLKNPPIARCFRICGCGAHPE